MFDLSLHNVILNLAAQKSTHLTISQYLWVRRPVWPNRVLSQTVSAREGHHLKARRGEPRPCSLAGGRWPALAGSSPRVLSLGSSRHSSWLCQSTSE